MRWSNHDAFVLVENGLRAVIRAFLYLVASWHIAARELKTKFTHHAHDQASRLANN